MFSGTVKLQTSGSQAPWEFSDLASPLHTTRRMVTIRLTVPPVSSGQGLAGVRLDEEHGQYNYAPGDLGFSRPCFPPFEFCRDANFH